jgi:hypothetical protein
VTAPLQKSAIFLWLKKTDATLAGRLVLIRQELEEWLPYVIQLFPHYPSHGVDHSDRIVSQLSKLLFRGSRPTISLSAGEAYCLLAAAYLHDSGMVVSPGETERILQSERWATFVSEGEPGYTAYVRYQDMLQNRPNSDRWSYLAGLTLRQIVADFVRIEHHERSKMTLELHPFLRTLVDKGDPVAFETIASLAVGHGLQESDLADDARYPEERDVLTYKVNVRFLARLLRLGDLLDVSNDRSHALSAAAVAPLPFESSFHWLQYGSKTHENISPNSIEFRFECSNQETHRLLRDWFGWLENEVRTTAIEQAHAVRHPQWKAPRCFVSNRETSRGRDRGLRPTIIIEPASTAQYSFHDWRLELDNDKIFERLVFDVYSHPSIFVRELIQNAVDATRCQMYADASLSGRALLESLTELSEELRDQYPVKVSFSEEQSNDQNERKLVLVVEDFGTGMDESIILKYFLQAGRSYYQSAEFRKQFRFAPASRFGVGFLSVFAVSKDIVVETARPNTGRGIRLRLREPRSYLLTEPWIPFPERPIGRRHGTRVTVVVDNWDGRTELLHFIDQVCVAVEIPIIVRVDGIESVVRASGVITESEVAVSKVDPEGRFVVKPFVIQEKNVEGTVAIIAYKDRKGEGWCDCWPHDLGLDGKRCDELPKDIGGYVALHGFALSGQDPSQQWITRADVRVPSAHIGVDRGEGHRGAWTREGQLASGAPTGAAAYARAAVQETAKRAVSEHLATSERARGPGGPLYVGRVLSLAPVPEEWRGRYPGSVVALRNGSRQEMSADEMLAATEICLATSVVENWLSQSPLELALEKEDAITSAVVVSWDDVPPFLKERLSNELFARTLTKIVQIGESVMVMFSKDGDGAPPFRRVQCAPKAWIGDFASEGIVGVSLRFLGNGAAGLVALNERCATIRWLNAFSGVAEKHGIPRQAVEACWSTAATTYWSLNDLLKGWQANPLVPEEWKPPKEQQKFIVMMVELDTKRRVHQRGPSIG